MPQRFFYGPNLLVRGDDICLIDWEYAAMGDYGCDIGNFIAQGSGYTLDEALAILPSYFGREPTAEERLHCIAATAVVGWYWYVWALFKECKGSPVGKWTRIWYDAARDFGRAAQQMIDESCSRRRALTRPSSTRSSPARRGARRGRRARAREPRHRGLRAQGVRSG